MTTRWTYGATKKRKYFARLRSASMAFVAATALAGVMAIVFSAGGQEQDQKQDQMPTYASTLPRA